VIDQVRPAKHLGNPYDNPALFEHLDSLEGVPDLLGPGETEAEREGWSDWQRVGNERFAALGTWAPGLALAAAVALAGGALADGMAGLLGLDRTPVSPILVAILLGLAIRHAVGLPQRRAILIAAGTAICGNTAIVSLAPVIRAEDDEVSYAVGCITLFGLLALIAYPFAAHGLFQGDATLAGLFLGTAIHDTAQVAGAGLVYLVQYSTPDALESATVTKLLRNMFMLVVIPGAAWLHQRGEGRAVPGGLAAQLRQAVPFFVFGFLAMSLLRSVGDLGDAPFGVLSAGAWKALIDGTTTVSSFCLALAMASVGLGTSVSRLRGLGMRPLVVGLVAALLVGGVSFATIRLLSGLGLLDALA
jgi:uncharacterized integral membrane protein (TIGR00698 family)